MDASQRRETQQCIDMLRQATRCRADPTLDPARRVDDPDAGDIKGAYEYVSLGWGGSDRHACRDYSRLYAWAEANRADDSTYF